MYLSQLVVNRSDPLVQRDLGNPYELHRTILGAFPRFAQARPRILFRVEFGWPTTILVQSMSQPDWRGLLALGGYLRDTPVIKTVDGLTIDTGQDLYFRLRANPTRKPTGTKNRVALIEPQARLDWLSRQGSTHGFSPAPGRMVVTAGPWQTFAVGKPSAGRNQITINFVDFEGYLVVTDRDKLMQAMQSGIGPAKGFGCGLLSLARV